MITSNTYAQITFPYPLVRSTHGRPLIPSARGAAQELVAILVQISLTLVAHSRVIHNLNDVGTVRWRILRDTVPDIAITFHFYRQSNTKR